MRRQRGEFTLIELLIVISLLAVMVTIALPAYQDYTLRSRAGAITVKQVCDWNLADLEILSNGIEIGQAYSAKRVSAKSPSSSLFVMMTKNGLRAATTSALATTVTFEAAPLAAVLGTIQGYCAVEEELPMLHGFAVQQLSETFEIILGKHDFFPELTAKNK